MRLGDTTLGDARIGSSEADAIEEVEYGSERAFLGDNYLGSRYLGQGETPYGEVGGGETNSPASYPVAENADIVEAIAPQGPDATRERLNHHLKQPFDISEGDPGDPEYTKWDGFLDTMGEEFERVEYARSEATLARFVDHAQSGALDKIGSLVDTPRRHDEPDRLYRARLKMELRVQTSGGTIEEMKEAVANILRAPPSRIRIDETFPEDPASFRLGIPRSEVEDANLQIDELVDIVRRTKAAGVEVFGILRGGFTHRSLMDFQNDINSPNRGYGQLDPAGNIREDIGGEYASLFGDGRDTEITF